jgi:putative ATPase
MARAPDLFGEAPAPSPGRRPLADRLRPTRLAEVIGQDHLVGPEGRLTAMLARGSLQSLILWGPPGVGKTSIARLLAEAAGLPFTALSAVFSGVADLKRAFEEARLRRGTLLFVDEIHRFNRAQQDGFLGVVEEGVVVLVGATTENPSFALNGALLSRCQVLVLERLSAPALDALLDRATAAEGRALPLTEAGREALLSMADGDGRYLLNLVEQLLALPPRPLLDPAMLADRLARRAAQYDRDRDGHYGLISALHKSLRGSDPDAALYWLARMLAGGEDPRFIARRLVRFASEDIGMADPRALQIALAGWDAFERLGAPEGELALAQVVVHLGSAPKSNATYVAFKAAMQAARETGSLAPPAHILNAPTRLMAELGRGVGYQYDHDLPEGFSGANYWPAGMAPRQFYAPTDRGAEAAVGDRLARWAALRRR